MMKDIKKFISAGMAAAIAAMCFAGMVIVQADDNLLTNGDFESETAGGDAWKFSSTTNWNNIGGTTAERTTSKHNGGSYSALVNEGTFGQRVTLQAGTSYTLEAYVMADAETTNPCIGFYQDDEYGYPSNTPVQELATNATTSWQKVTVKYNCTADGSYVICLKSWKSTNGTAVNVYFDDVTLTGVEGEYDGGGIENGNFADGAEGWIVSDATAASADTGALVASGTVRVSQTATDLEPGTYNLTATAYTSEIKTTGASYLYAKTKGHTIASTAIPEGTTAYKIIVPSIVVGKDGTCEIGLNLDNSASVTLDNLAFEQTEDTRVKFYKGGEISKLSYIESHQTSSDSVKFKRSDGTEADALQVMAENGFNLARIRLLDDPGQGHGDGSYFLPAGYMDLADCLSLARRAKDKGMDIELTIAYSDYWVDAGQQFMPYAWKAGAEGLTGENRIQYFEDSIYNYTKDSLQAFIDQGTPPELVSIGNEMQNGLFFGKWSDDDELYDNMAALTRFVNAGAKAVRELLPEAKVVIHTDKGGEVQSQRKRFLSVIKDADYDVIGISYYPAYNSSISIDTVVNEFKTLINTYNKDVIVMETGYNWNQYKKGGNWEGQLQDSGYYQSIYGESQEGQRAFLTELYAKLKTVLGGRCIGDLYWDPVMIKADSTVSWAQKEPNGANDREVVSNSTIFDFNGKSVAGQLAMKYNTESSDTLNITGKIKTSTASTAYAQNKEVTFTVNGVQYNRTTDKYGDYIVSIPYPEDGKVSISLKGSGTEYTDVDAPTYEGILMSGCDFSDFDTEMETDPTPVPTAAPTVAPTDTPTVTDNPTPTDTVAPTERGSITHLNAIKTNTGVKFSAQYSTDETDKLFFVALYGDNDKLIACKKAVSETGIESGEFELSTEVRDTVKNIKAFLWNGGHTPLCGSESSPVETSAP